MKKLTQSAIETFAIEQFAPATTLGFDPFVRMAQLSGNSRQLDFSIVQGGTKP
jgi:hypothetical protein